MYLFFDTETSGLPKSEGTSLTLQPHIVQFAAILCDENVNEVSCFSTLVRPEGWTIDEGAENVHGISHAKATRYGISIKSVMSTFVQLSRTSTTLVAHNITFDEKLVRFELERLEQPDHLATLVKKCTMHSSTDLCKLPGKYGKYKWPRLEEVYKFLFNESVLGSHDALVDVRATVRVFKELKKRNLV